jgi:CheY-like chemotaxis protein/anti-sigma regulatory factor (Ser/Thr protein kinase)
MTRIRAQDKQLAMVLRCDPDLPDLVLTDPTCFRQILVHLVRNAVDFTDHGEVRIFARGRPLDNRMLRLEIAVSDTGVGISPERLQKVFEPLTQAGASLTRRDGAGLGLAISQRLAQALGGDIQVQSEPGRGSTFTLAIPVELPDESAANETSPGGIAKASSAIRAAGSQRGRILLVDDAPGVRFVVVELLKQLGLDVDVAGDGKTGCEMVINSSAEGRPYDLVLMDLEMPVRNGLDAARRLRQWGWRGPLVALTANALAGDRERCLAAGCDDYLSKPVTGNDLERVVARFVSRETPATPHANDGLVP